MPAEYEGRDVAARFCASPFGAGRRFELVPARANGQPAFGAYLRVPAGIRHAAGSHIAIAQTDGEEGLLLRLPGQGELQRLFQEGHRLGIRTFQKSLAALKVVFDGQRRRFIIAC